MSDQSRADATCPGMTAASLGRLDSALQEQQVLDLTLTVAEDLPCWWPTHLPFQHKTFNYFVDHPDPMAPVHCRCGPYQTRWLAMDEHTGTHFDAPSHFIPPEASGLPHAGPAGALTADQVDPGQFMGPAAVIDVPQDLPGGGPGVSPDITPEMVTAWEARHGSLHPGTVVLLRTGWDSRYLPGEAGRSYVYNILVTRTEPGWPAPTVATVELLAQRGVRCLGTDAPSVGSSHDGGPAHVTGLGKGMVFIEALGELGLLPTWGAYFIFLPIKVRYGTGAPGRALAFVPRLR